MNTRRETIHLLIDHTLHTREEHIHRRNRIREPRRNVVARVQAVIDEPATHASKARARAGVKRVRGGFAALIGRGDVGSGDGGVERVEVVAGEPGWCVDEGDLQSDEYAERE